ncbi:hypothetical protein RchiOBHm_Chr4g0387311 [Rosa chinensis]|uniref:Uncharacterized protein n=1 Tax=Rosa chinensis TaxID=74649 RepID=A0A2P6QPH5_ROSCH|nr:hypothetical protein RchiOBHm_Chr4g0387311 [Rosa chinensis]
MAAEPEPADESGVLEWLLWLNLPTEVFADPEQKMPRSGANDDYYHQQEQQEQPIVMIPSKRHCTEGQPSMPPIPIIDDDFPIPSSNYSVSTSTSDMWRSPLDQIFQASNWQANLDLLPNSQSTLGNLEPTSPATPEFQQ